MKTRNKIILDELFARPALFILNIIARILGRLLSIDHSLDKPPSRIAVCKFIGMGSIIQSTPLLQTLRKNFPEAEIIFITSHSNRKLLESIGVIDKIFDIEDRSFTSVLRTSFMVLRSLWANKPDIYIDLEAYSYFSTVLATLSCSKNRFGFYRVERNIRMGVYTHMMFFNARAPIAQSYLQMARLLGCKENIEKLYPFNITDTVRMSYRRKITEITGSLPDDYVVINPNASDLRIERRWPAENFAQLIKNLRLKYPEKIFLLIGTANEQKWVSGVYNRLDEKARKYVYNTAGKFSLYELFACIENTKLVVSNDTGPMHVSFAFERPTVSLFGPASPTQYGQNANAFGVYKNIYCSPCVHDFLTPPCKGDNQCMKQITVAEVEGLCHELLTLSNEKGKTLTNELRFLKNDDKTSLGIVERGKARHADPVNTHCPCCDSTNLKSVYENLSSVYSPGPWNIAECLSCGNLITLPVPQQEMLDEIYNEKYFYSVHKLILNEKKYRSVQLANYLRKTYGSNQSKELLEIGCMYGYLLDELRNDFTVSGIEIGDDAVNYCVNRGLNVKKSSLANYFAGEIKLYDVIILSHVFEHLLEPGKVLAELKKRLTPGGSIILLVPNSTSFSRKINGRNWGWWQVPVHVNHFSESALRKLAFNNELKVTGIRKQGGDSLMILLNFMNLFSYRSKKSEPGNFQKNVIGIFSAMFRYWYAVGDEELTVILSPASTKD